MGSAAGWQVAVKSRVRVQAEVAARLRHGPENIGAAALFCDDGRVRAAATLGTGDPPW
jgi:hypothetical protein